MHCYRNDSSITKYPNAKRNIFQRRQIHNQTDENLTFYEYGDVVQFTCEEGYQFSTKNTSVSYSCEQNDTRGVWVSSFGEDLIFGCICMIFTLLTWNQFDKS